MALVVSPSSIANCMQIWMYIYVFWPFHFHFHFMMITIKGLLLDASNYYLICTRVQYSLFTIQIFPIVAAMFPLPEILNILLRMHKHTMAMAMVMTKNS